MLLKRGSVLVVEKDKKAKCIMTSLCAGIILGSILTIILDNVYFLTIFAGIGSSIGLIYVNIKSKK